MLVQPTLAPQYFRHSSGSTHATTSGIKSIGSAGCKELLKHLGAIEHHNSLTGIEDPADHARENHEEHGQQLQVATQDAARLHVR